MSFLNFLGNQDYISRTNNEAIVLKIPQNAFSMLLLPKFTKKKHITKMTHLHKENAKVTDLRVDETIKSLISLL